jgi:ABC-type branched-subunit amino acid transport system ATPase component
VQTGLIGGEQRMLAVTRALAPRPRLIILNEPSLDLAYNLVTAILNKACEFNRETGVAVLIIEHNVSKVVGIADRAYGLRLARVVREGHLDQTTTENLLTSSSILLDRPTLISIQAQCNVDPRLLPCESPVLCKSLSRACSNLRLQLS